MHGPNDIHAMERILEDNEALALHNREHFDEDNIFAINFMSAPGAGKTTLLENLFGAMVAETNSTAQNIAVLEGDMVGQLDRDRLQAIGLNAYQISTGKSCHLDAQMVARFLHENDIFKEAPQNTHKVLFIENVGNLVCPAEFPLGEHLKVVLLCVTEGDDKPFKYPIMFQAADAVVLSKCDLLEYVNFNMERFREYMRSLNPDCPIFCISLPQKQKAENLRSKELVEFKAWLEEKMPVLETAI